MLPSVLLICEPEISETSRSWESPPDKTNILFIIFSKTNMIIDSKIQAQSRLEPGYFPDVCPTKIQDLGRGRQMTGKLHTMKSRSSKFHGILLGRQNNSISQLSPI